MRVAALALVLVVTLLQLLLGVTHILGSSYRAEVEAAAPGNAPSLVADQLEQSPAPPAARSFEAAAGAQLLLGVLCLAGVVIGIAATFVLVRARGRRIALALLGAGCVASLVHLVATSDGATLTLIAAALFALALGATLLGRWERTGASAP